MVAAGIARGCCAQRCQGTAMVVACLGTLLLMAALVQPADAQAANQAGIGGVMIGAHLVHPKPGPPPPGIGPMYQAYAVVTGTDMRQRPWGFARCLREVLVKVSGNPRLASDPRTAKLGQHAERFVAAFTYTDLMAGDPLHDDQGTFDRPYKLMVYFVPRRIDAALARLGERPWQGSRPVIVPVIEVAGPHPPPYLLSAENPAGAEQRGSFVRAAATDGMKVRFPTRGELGTWGISAERFPSATAALPASPTPGEMIVLGTLRWSETLPGWIGSWRTVWHGVARTWGVRGVNYDTAFSDLVGGAVLLASGR